MSKLEEALSHHQRGDLEEAERDYLEILQSEPNHPDALHLLGVVAGQRAEPARAAELIEKAIALDPMAAYHKNLGGALRAQGRLEAAIGSFGQSLAIEFDDDTLDSLARTLIAHGAPEQALECYLRALSLWPENKRARDGLVSLLRTVRPAGHWAELEDALIECFRSNDIVPQHLAGVTANQLEHKYAFHERLPLTGSATDFLDTLSRDRLFLNLLTDTVNVDFEVERFLTALRRYFLLAFDHSTRMPKGYVELLASLALQCFNNEHVFNLDVEEFQAVEKLAVDMDTSRDELEVQALLLACYRPLASLRGADGLAASDTANWCPQSRMLLTRTLVEPLAEMAIENEIESLGAIEDATSEAVRAQYEENPYPRWLNLGESNEYDLVSTLRARFPHFALPDFLAKDPRILIAGCGTGEEVVRFAVSNPGSEIVAIDLSRRSLAYAVRMARRFGVDNVRFLQGDILEADKLDGRFHVISSVGVLHHLANPIAGWRLLADKLSPSGLMRIALYSESARRPLTAARDEIERRGLKPTTEDIREFRTLVLGGSIDGELGEFSTGREFYSLSDCRDLLFHVEEHLFTPAQIGEALAEIGLNLVGFDLSNLNVPSSFHQEFQFGRRMIDIEDCERIEVRYPRAFVSMYRFWCQKR